MFASFFPRPKMFFISAALWALVAILFWYFVARDLAGSLSLGGWLGWPVPAALPEGADEAATAAFAAASDNAITAWLYQYMLVCGILFILA